MSPLRVVHIDSGQTWRGGQRQALLLALGLRQRGHEPFLIGFPECPLADRARAAGLAVATIRMRADWDLRAAKKIRSRIHAWSADVVHAHDARSHALAMLALLGRRTVPLIVTRRVPFTPRSARLKYGDRVARFIAISNAVRDAMVDGGIDPARIDVVYSGISLPAVEVPARDWRAELGWTADTVLCGIVGAMTVEKGLDSLAAVARQIPAEIATRMRLVLLGGAAAGMRDIAGIPAYYAGFIEEIEPAMAGLDLLLHPSRTEGLGTAVLDAMALGVPAVAFATGGIPEVITHQATGLLVPEGDLSGFAGAACRLVADPGLRKTMGDAARVRAKSFDALEMTKGTEAVYNRVLRGWR